ncbi:MAG TPA: VapC toxin family PIN domain ribonuclease [Deltaproteobacteria bacterium]|nr:MAG: hypothetical protein A2048_11030 [Deltaproteobacteria bacterium GWA2_45_12]HBF13507.1 VapC toxin family PIN domain ribonuclease [Deltaproteobacteria bacterium]
MDIVLDCSVVMSWCFQDEKDAHSVKVLDSLSKNKAHVPSLLFLEVSNVLVMAERKGRLTVADTARFLDLLTSLPLRIDEEPKNPETYLFLAREHGLTSYDACYLELAMRTGSALATKDKSLKNACKKSGVVLF